MAAEYDTATSVWDIVSHVISSQYRCAILRHLSESPGTPTGIANGAGYDLSHVSRALAELRDRDLIELLVDEDTKVGRLYGPTEMGERIWSTIEANGLADHYDRGD